MKLRKKTVSTTLALGLVISMLSPLMTHAETAKQPVNTMNKVAVKKDTNYLPSLSKFEDYIKKVSNKKEYRFMWNVNSKYELYRVLDIIYQDLPTQVSILSSVSKEDANKWHNEYLIDRIPSQNINIHTLASYSISKSMPNIITLTDTSHRVYSGKQIQTGLKSFSKEFAKQIEGLTTEEKIKVIYDYIYSQFSYKASNYKDMLVGNAYNKEMACNGFSRLFYELALASGLNVKVIEADDHFYNHVEVNGQWIIIDVTTDILLKNEHGATGLSKEDYLDYVSNVGFYWATPVERETAVASKWTKEQKEAFLDIPTPTYSYK